MNAQECCQLLQDHGRVLGFTVLPVPTHKGGHQRAQFPGALERRDGGCLFRVVLRVVSRVPAAGLPSCLPAAGFVGHDRSSLWLLGG